MTTHVTKEPVVLEGYQAILKPSEYGYSLSALLPKEIIDKLEEEREGGLDWARSKAKNPKRATVNPEPWEEVGNGVYQCKFRWKSDDKIKPVVVDTEGTVITDTNIPIYSGSKVKLAFIQKPYNLPSGNIGTSLKLKAIQVVSLNSGAGVVDNGDLDAEEATALFGTTKGFKTSEPNPVAAAAFDENDDF
jgi:hypothetical protein